MIKYFVKSINDNNKIKELIAHLRSTKEKDINYQKLLEYTIEDVLYDEKENELWDKDSVKIISKDNYLIMSFTKKEVLGPEDIAITYTGTTPSIYEDIMLNSRSDIYIGEEEAEELLHICRRFISNAKIPYKRERGFFRQSQYEDMEA